MKQAASRSLKIPKVGGKTDPRVRIGWLGLVQGICSVTRGSVGSREATGHDRGGEMAKFHARPSLQYRYEHYDPRFL
jgi:hypothetical protein